ncbi:hypothetical protein J056_000488 [Wallemia ichthyophaga EXF-994]|uniref:Nudix hydrolase domain-containing protein n=2 Tax=Wallemia ichthyophaga TaxID=245174 RepID=R9AES6_WALI9|nr:uncharacterized protein J056_000488 [Wallemia ichthyophaga EXF-994]TIA70467.1 hypothetical protein E3P91_03073 [Wallemia ichthyophaga]EOR00678.1 hypothetical protein J056_000488 [Wallemia ichthyophaga EXF-994]TIA97191.1 hypothetical protein E3P95_02952 [Wallemia ichthyophaga]TIA98421.1 hypothetical protein E3P94_02953 [Wallemia ichthyophaga]TIB01307.1 hypothetical protein E3P96_02437 [Wallemia ichthyophaga]
MTSHAHSLKLDDVAGLNENSKAYLQRLSEASIPRTRYPSSSTGKHAAVMVAIFVGRLSDLHVLLSQRSPLLSAYPSDTCLIGGKRDEQDIFPEDTARREAEEEVGLPRSDLQRVRYVATLPPHLAYSNASALTVWPVVCLITDRALVPMLNEDEVQRLFSHPLQSFLCHKADSLLLRLKHLESPDDIYHWHFDDIDPVAPSHHLRKHVFETGRNGVKPILGFTARVMIRVASIAFDTIPHFRIDAPDQIPEIERVTMASGAKASL